MPDPFEARRTAFRVVHDLAAAGATFNEIAARLGATAGQLAYWMESSKRLKTAFRNGRVVARQRDAALAAKESASA